MKAYIKTALITSIAMLVLVIAAGIFIGMDYFSRKEKAQAKSEEEIDMNLYGGSKVEIGGEPVYDLKVSGEGKNVQTFSYKNAASIYDVSRSAAAKERLDGLKKKNSYSIETPLWAYNPFGTNKLSMYLYFKTSSEYSLKYTIHTEEERIPDFTRDCFNGGSQFSKEHEYQITGLVPGVKNYIFLYLYDRKGEVEKQVIYSITPKSPKGAPPAQLSEIEGKSSEKLSNGLFVFLGEDIYFYDNSGVLRGIAPLEGGEAANLLLLDGQMIYNYSKDGFAFVDSMGQVQKTLSLESHTIYKDFIYDGYGHLLILASKKKANSVGDRVLSLDLRNGEKKELVDFGKLIPKMKKKASKGKGSKKLDWLDLNSIAMAGSDSILVSSRELSSVIKVSHVTSVKPEVGYIIAQDMAWAGTSYEALLYGKAEEEEGAKLFRSQFGQSSLLVDKDLASEQYYITMLNHNYAYSPTRKKIPWSDVDGVGTKKKEASSSKYYQYYVDESAGTYTLSNSFNVPYSKEGSLFSYGSHFIINEADNGAVREYDGEGRLIRGIKYGKEAAPSRVQKQDMKGFWYR